MPRVGRSRRLVVRASRAVDVALGGPEHRMTFLWHPEDQELRQLRVALAQVAFEAFGLEALPRVRMPLLEGERLVILKASSPRPGGVLGPTLESIGTFVDDAPEALFDASLVAFALEHDGERRVGVQLVNVRCAPEPATHQSRVRRS